MKKKNENKGRMGETLTTQHTQVNSLTANVLLYYQCPNAQIWPFYGLEPLEGYFGTCVTTKSHNYSFTWLLKGRNKYRRFKTIGDEPYHKKPLFCVRKTTQIEWFSHAHVQRWRATLYERQTTYTSFTLTFKHLLITRRSHQNNHSKRTNAVYTVIEIYMVAIDRNNDYNRIQFQGSRNFFILILSLNLRRFNLVFLIVINETALNNLFAKMLSYSPNLHFTEKHFTFCSGLQGLSFKIIYFIPPEGCTLAFRV